MAFEFSLTMAANWVELERLNDAINQFALDQRWTNESLFQVKLVMEELVTNVINHGLGNNLTPQIDMHCTQNGTDLTINMSDTGSAFDPLQKAPPDLNVDIDQRAIGGLGVYLVRELMDEIQYQRVGSRNILRMVKQLPVQT
jgi:anti-sigma regulatory factor (Ser/Thr protein kinase)